jgi:hypothetical protein
MRGPDSKRAANVSNNHQCYKPQAPELGSILNFARQMFSFAMSFYAIPFAQLVGVQNAWIVMALITVFFFLPLIPLFFRGEEWRKRLGKEALIDVDL